MSPPLERGASRDGESGTAGVGSPACKFEGQGRHWDGPSLRHRVAGGVPPVVILLVTIGGVAMFGGEPPACWPQFRGPGGLGVALAAKPPIEFSPTNHLRWHRALPPGNSSPCVWGDRLFLTGFQGGRLETYCLARSDGSLLWTRQAPAEKIEAVYPRLGNPASPTPATDGVRVYVYFGSAGLLAYDLDGRQVWARPLPTPVTEFGTGASPVIAGDSVVINCDQDIGSYLLAVKRRNGQVAWRQERPGFPRGFGTPLVWRHDGLEEIVVPGTVWVKAYAVSDGSERWRSRGQGRVVCPSPAAGDGRLFVASWAPGGDAANRLGMPAWESFLAEHDRNQDGRLTRDEFPPGPLLERFSQIDANKDQVVTPAEWKAMAEIFAGAENTLIAIRPGGQGDITETHVAWRQTRGLPYVPSPLFFQGRVYLVKSGGLVSCFNADTGKALYLEERLEALGDYYASPVAAADRIYACSQNGTVVVFAAGDALNVLARNNLGDSIMATPAIVDDVLYVRTAEHLYAFCSDTAH